MSGTAESGPLLGHTLFGRLEEVAQERAEHEALVFFADDGSEHRLTYGALVARVLQLSAGLAELGAWRGDRVGLWMTNHPDWVVTMFATLRLGAVLVPINTWLTPPEVQYIVRQSGMRQLVMMDRFRKIDFVEGLRQICPEWARSALGQLRSAAAPDLRTVVVRGGAAPPGAVAFEQAVALGDGAAAAQHSDRLAAQVSPNSLALIKYTSGSTGFPKGAMLEQGPCVANALMHTNRLGTGSADRWFNPSPLFHAGGSIWGLLSVLMRGATLVFTEAFDGRRSVELIEQERCTVVFGVPAMLRDELRVLREQGRKVDCVRVAIGATPEIAREARELLGAQTTFAPYGLTEAYGPVALSGPDDPIQRQEETSGRFLPGFTYRIVGSDGETMAPGAAGEIQIRGLIMRGYWQRPEETAAALDADGWLHTGDLGAVDHHGYLTYLGRIKAMLKIGGENVAVEEVENALLAMEPVAECVLVGVPDPRMDQIGRIYVELTAPEAASAEDLRRWCTERLARFKVPREFVIVPALPRTGSGKPDRAAVERWAAEGVEPAVGTRA